MTGHHPSRKHASISSFDLRAAGVALDSTAYCQGTITASGRPPFVGEVANNLWPLGTRISVSPPVWGRTRFVVLDRIGWGSSLDFYNSSCSAADLFGRRIEQVHIIR